MKTITEEKKQAITENYKESKFDGSLVEYTNECAENDPNFFRWLFGTEGNDFECPDEQAWDDFKNQL